MESLREQNILRNNAKMAELDKQFGISLLNAPKIKEREKNKTIKAKDQQPQKRSKRLLDLDEKEKVLNKNNTFFNDFIANEFDYEYENHYNDGDGDDDDDDDNDDDDDDYDHENEEKSSVDSEEKIILSDKKVKTKTILPEIHLKNSEDKEFISFQKLGTASNSEKDQFHNDDIKNEKVTLSMVNNFMLQKTESQRQKKIIEKNLTFNELHNYILGKSKEHYRKLSFSSMKVCVERMNVLNLQDLVDRLEHLTSYKT